MSVLTIFKIDNCNSYDLELLLKYVNLIWKNVNKFMKYYLLMKCNETSSTATETVIKEEEYCQTFAVPRYRVT